MQKNVQKLTIALKWIDNCTKIDQICAKVACMLYHCGVQM